VNDLPEDEIRFGDVILWSDQDEHICSLTRGSYYVWRFHDPGVEQYARKRASVEDMA
jgi:hypothetical protein